MKGDRVICLVLQILRFVSSQAQLGFYHIVTFSECAAYFTSSLDTSCVQKWFCDYSSAVLYPIRKDVWHRQHAQFMGKNVTDKKLQTFDPAAP